MTQGEMDCLRESCSIPLGILIRLFKVGKTIASTHPGEVAFYEATFHCQADLALLQHLSHLACPQCMMKCRLHGGAVAILQVHPILYRVQEIVHFVQKFETRLRMTRLQGATEEDFIWWYPSNVKGQKKKFFFIFRDDWEFSLEVSREVGVPRVMRSWCTPGCLRFKSRFSIYQVYLPFQTNKCFIFR